MKIKLMSPALRRRFGEVVDSKDLPKGHAEHYIANGVAVEIKSKKKSTTSKKDTGEKRAKDSDE